jgi:hypothetical protein
MRPALADHLRRQRHLAYDSSAAVPTLNEFVEVSDSLVRSRHTHFTRIRNADVSRLTDFSGEA